MSGACALIEEGGLSATRLKGGWLLLSGFAIAVTCGTTGTFLWGQVTLGPDELPSVAAQLTGAATVSAVCHLISKGLLAATPLTGGWSDLIGIGISVTCSLGTDRAWGWLLQAEADSSCDNRWIVGTLGETAIISDCAETATLEFEVEACASADVAAGTHNVVWAYDGPDPAEWTILWTASSGLSATSTRSGDQRSADGLLGSTLLGLFSSSDWSVSVTATDSNGDPIEISQTFTIDGTWSGTAGVGSCM